MKTLSFPILCSAAFAAFASVLPSTAQADEWIADPLTPGAFGDGENWSNGVVPDSARADIFNGGTAQVGEGGAFFLSVLSLGGFSGMGSLEQSGGTIEALQVIVGGDDLNGGSGSGTLTMTGGALSGMGGTEMWLGSRGGTATVTMSGNASLTNNNWIVIGRDVGGTATVVLNDQASIAGVGANNVAIGVFSGTTSTVTLNDSAALSSNNDLRIGWGNTENTQGVVNAHGTATISSAGTTHIGYQNARGTVTLTGDSKLSAGNELYVGSDGTASNGVLDVRDNAVVEVTNGLVVGRQNATGTMTVSDHADIRVHGFLVVGADGSGTGTMTVGGQSTVTADHQIWISQAGTSTGTLNINGGTTTAHADFAMDASGAGVAFRGAAGTLNLNGGTLITPGFNRISGVARVNFNGGTLRASGVPVADFFMGFSDGDIVLQAGGMKLDSNGFDLTIVQSLAGDGGLTKLGAGTLTLSGAPGYLGDTRVEAGTLSLLAVGLADSANVFLTSGAFFDLSTNGEVDTINALVIDGVAQATGTWGAIGSGADHTTALITGDGVLNVTSTVVPEPSTILLVLAGLATVGVVRRRGARRS